MATFTDYLKNTILILIVLQIAPPLLKNIKHLYFDNLKPSTKVAFLTINGILYDSSCYVSTLKNFFHNDDIKAIILKFESPGGAAGSAEAIAHEISVLKQTHPKPIVSLCENICTSGSYYIASTTDFIVAPPSALIGGIGTTIPYQFKVHNLLEKLGVQYVPISAGDYKNSTDPFVAITENQKEQLKSVVDDSYATFIEHVARHRTHVSLAQATEWANGRIFTGKQALEKGLIDALGSSTTVINHIKKLATIEDEIEWVTQEPSTSLWSMLTGSRDDQHYAGASMQNTQELGKQEITSLTMLLTLISNSISSLCNVAGNFS